MPAHLPRPYHAALVLCALFGGALVLYSTGIFGIAKSNDSAAYLSAARNVMRGSGINHFSGTPLVVLAPFYPFVLGVIGWLFQTDPLRIAPAVNAVLYGGIVYCGGRVAFRVIESRALALTATFALVLARNLLFVSAFAWSETLFIFLTVLALWLAYDYLAKPNTKALALVAVVLALACLTRYAGLALLSWGVLLTLGVSPAERKRQVRDTFLLLGIVLLPLGLWAMRNYAASGTFFGGRPASMFSLGQNVGFALNTIRLWYLPPGLASNLLLALGLGILAVILSVVGWRAHPAPFKRFLHAQAPVLGLAICYIVFLIVSATTTAFDRIGERLLSPAYVPLLLVLFGWLDAVAKAISARVPRRIANGALGLLVVGWLGYIAFSTGTFISNTRRDGMQYTGPLWRTSPTIAYLRARQFPQDCPLASNNPSGVYLLTDLVSSATPVKSKYNSPEVVFSGVEELRDQWPGEAKTCFIWFENVEKRFYFQPQELQRIARMQPLGIFQDGAIYLVTRE